MQQSLRGLLSARLRACDEGGPMGSFFSVLGAFGVAVLIVSASLLAFLFVGLIFGGMFLAAKTREALT